MGSLGFGHGVHACVGRVLALLEAEALLGRAGRSTWQKFEAAGEPEPWMTTIGHGPIKLPVRMTLRAPRLVDCGEDHVRDFWKRRVLALCCITPADRQAKVMSRTGSIQNSVVPAP